MTEDMFAWGCHGERGSRGPYPLRWHIPVCSERRHVEDGGSAMDPWGGNGCEGVFLKEAVGLSAEARRTGRS